MDSPAEPRIANSDTWKYLTTTVGLVVTNYRNHVNVMAAEWTYFLNKNPLYVAVALSRKSITRTLIGQIGEFSVTLCSDSQAEIADFVGSFSGDEIDKASCTLLDLQTPVATSTPWIPGGVAAFECAVKRVVQFPDYKLYVGQAEAIHRDAERRPLVKHGFMHSLGERLEKTAVVGAAQMLNDEAQQLPWLRIAASGASPGMSYKLTLIANDGTTSPLGECPADPKGDLLVDTNVPWPEEILSQCRVLIECTGLKSALTRVSLQKPLVVHQPSAE